MNVTAFQILTSSKMVNYALEYISFCKFIPQNLVKNWNNRPCTCRNSSYSLQFPIGIKVLDHALFKKWLCGSLPHVKNFGDQVTLTQIGIQATARQTGFPWWQTIPTMHELLREVFTLGSASKQLKRRRSSAQSVSNQDASDQITRTVPAVHSVFARHIL
jgi:hypothetical protein